jgi:hypothetical protein
MRFLLPILCLCCALDAAAQSTPPPALHSQAALQALLDAGGPSPLDAFTPYGKRRFLRGIAWGSRGVGGFSVASPVRELDESQLAAVLDLIDARAYLPRLRAELLGAPLRLPEPSAGVERALLALEAAADAGRDAPTAAATTTPGAPRLGATYATLFGARMEAAALRRAPSADLPALFDAAALANLWNPASPAFGHLLLVHRELGARGIDTRRTFDATVLQALEAARRFDAAKAFRAAHPALADAALPDVADRLGPAFQGRSVFRYDAGANTLTRAAAPVPAGAELVIMVGANCHYSQDALAAIHADPDLQARLVRAHVMLVTPPDASVPYRFIGAWNAANPALPLNAPHDLRGWEAMRMADVPHFYLLKEGKVVAEGSGWPAGGNKAALVRLLERATP